MSLSSTQSEALEHYKDLYEQAVENNDVEEVNSILVNLRHMGFKNEARTLLENTKLSKLVTKGCKSKWETTDPTQADL